MAGNRNVIITNGWSNPESEELYRLRWVDDPACKILCEEGLDCGNCSFFVDLKADWGLCNQAGSRHYLETVKDSFTCPEHSDGECE